VILERNLMRNLYRRNGVSVLFGVILLISLPLTFIKVSADVAPPEQPPGSNLAPGEDSTQVQMLSETVLFEVQTAPWPGVPLTSVVRDWAKVTANFTMLNHGQVDETMQVRFPLTNPRGWGDGWGEYPEIEDIRVWVDGSPVSTSEVTSPSPRGDDDPPIVWAGFDVTFPAGEQVEIEVRYSQRATGYHPQSVFTYILETGAGWKDAIGSGEMIVRVPYTASHENVLVQHSSGGMRFAGADARWSFEDLEPSGEDNLRVTIIEPGYWLAVIGAQGIVDNNPDDGDAWGDLARAIKRVTLEHKGWLREDDAGKALYQASVNAYQKAVTLAPDVAKWHAGYAELLWHKIWLWPDYGAPEMITILEQLQDALEIEPDNEQAWQILNDMRQSAPLALSIEGTGVDYLLLTATVQPSPTSTPEVTSSPTSTSTPTPVPSATLEVIEPTQEEDEAPPVLEEEERSAPLNCLGGMALMAGFPLVMVTILKRRTARSTRRLDNHWQ
jgi:hypothetical protein